MAQSGVLAGLRVRLIYGLFRTKKLPTSVRRDSGSLPGPRFVRCGSGRSPDGGLIWLYVALGFGSLLAWTITIGVRWVIALVGLSVAVGALLPRARFRMPAALPLGLWISACLMGWWREDGLIRCDDYFAARSGGADVVVATTEELAGCKPVTAQ